MIAKGQPGVPKGHQGIPRVTPIILVYGNSFWTVLWLILALKGSYWAKLLCKMVHSHQLKSTIQVVVIIVVEGIEVLVTLVCFLNNLVSILYVCGLPCEAVYQLYILNKSLYGAEVCESCHYE